MNVQFQQQVNIKFCVKLGETATESLQLLHDAYGDEALCQVQVFVWHRWFVSGRVSVEDDTRSCWPSSSCSEDNMARIRDHTVTVCMLVDALNISKSICHQILWEDLGKQKLNARLVPHAPTEDQKQVWASVCADLLWEAQNNSTFINSIIG
jgi:hypothetical protein